MSYAHRDWYEALMIRLTPAIEVTPSNVTIRPLPRFAVLEHFKAGKGFKATIPTARRTWWALGWVGQVVLWLGGVPLAYVSSWAGGDWDRRRAMFIEPYFVDVLFLFFLAVIAAVSFVIWRVTHPRITVKADQTGIIVGGRRYGWERASGMRIGYSLGGVERSSQQMVYTGLRMAYGQWGDDLPYMVRNYYAPAYVVWLNGLLEAVAPLPADQGKVNADAGIKPALF
ncbi:MAG: hypothetical protein V2I43_25285 [Parvularcula sp.]|jgi:hypothetical protein|nr:hypothetical protein [Parvularcula sp.]